MSEYIATKITGLSQRANTCLAVMLGTDEKVKKYSPSRAELTYMYKTLGTMINAIPKEVDVINGPAPIVVINRNSTCRRCGFDRVKPFHTHCIACGLPLAVN